METDPDSSDHVMASFTRTVHSESVKFSTSGKVQSPQTKPITLVDDVLCDLEISCSQQRVVEHSEKYGSRIAPPTEFLGWDARQDFRKHS